jgi:small-conductance mechanosensitive channel
MKRWIVSSSVALIFMCAGTEAAKPQTTGAAAPNTAASATTDYASVSVEGRKLFDVMGNGGLTGAERADKIHRRLGDLIKRNDALRPFNKQALVELGNGTTIELDGEPVLTVTDADAQDAMATRDELALLWGGKMTTAIADARAVRRNPVKGAGILLWNSFSDLVVSLLQWLPRLAGAILLFALFWLLARVSRWGTKRILSHTHFDSNSRQLVRTLAYYGTWTVGALAILSTLGLQGGTIATTLGISGFVFGFAFKDILSHLFAGLMLLLGRQFHIGDQIVVKEFEGTVERVELRALYLRTYDNRLVIIPNGDVFTSIVTSNTASPHRRREFIIGIGQNEDIGKAQAVALEAVRSVEGVEKEPPADVLVDEITTSMVNICVRFHASSLRSDYQRIGSEGMRRVKEAFEREEISMSPAASAQPAVSEHMDGLTGSAPQSGTTGGPS